MRTLTGDEELHNMYASKNIVGEIKSRRMRWAEHVARMTDEKWTKILVGKPEGKTPLRRPRNRWVDIRKDLRETGWGGADWIHLAQDRGQWRAVMNAVMNLRVP
jgi:hypothetical protein